MYNYLMVIFSAHTPLVQATHIAYTVLIYIKMTMKVNSQMFACMYEREREERRNR